MEGSLKKEANTVCSLVEYAINKELELDCYNKIFSYCDAAGGQNRNYEFLQYFSCFSVKLHLEIQQLFPVQGHSYYEYVEIIKSARDPPFEVVNALKCNVKDFENQMVVEKKVQEIIKIGSVVKIVYFPKGQVDLYHTYSGEPTSIRMDKTFTILENSSNAPLAKGIGITREKIKYVGNLYIH